MENRANSAHTRLSKQALVHKMRHNDRAVSLMVTVDVKHHIYLEGKTAHSARTRLSKQALVHKLRYNDSGKNG